MIIHGISILFPAIVKPHIYLFSRSEWQDLFIGTAPYQTYYLIVHCIALNVFQRYMDVLNSNEIIDLIISTDLLMDE
jgi:hypothetical protein